MSNPIYNLAFDFGASSGRMILSKLEDGKITFTYITKEDEERVNAEVGDYDGIVNEGRNIEGVEVSIFIHEIDEGLKASLRSNDYVNVADVCMMFGGGTYEML